jgi:hypothetical protein
MCEFEEVYALNPGTTILWRQRLIVLLPRQPYTSFSLADGFGS